MELSHHVTFGQPAVAAVRLERTHQPEKHNLFNGWDIVQAHRRQRDRAWDEGAYCLNVKSEERVVIAWARAVSK